MSFLLRLVRTRRRAGPLLPRAGRGRRGARACRSSSASRRARSRIAWHARERLDRRAPSTRARRAAISGASRCMPRSSSATGCTWRAPQAVYPRRHVQVSRPALGQRAAALLVRRTSRAQLTQTPLCGLSASRCSPARAPLEAPGRAHRHEGDATLRAGAQRGVRAKVVGGSLDPVDPVSGSAPLVQALEPPIQLGPLPDGVISLTGIVLHKGGATITGRGDGRQDPGLRSGVEHGARVQVLPDLALDALQGVVDGLRVAVDDARRSPRTSGPRGSSVSTRPSSFESALAEAADQRGQLLGRDHWRAGSSIGEPASASPSVQSESSSVARRRVAERDVLVERRVLVPGRGLDGGDDLPGDAQLGERAERRVLVDAVVPDRLVEADEALLDEVVRIAAGEEVARERDPHEAGVAPDDLVLARRSPVRARSTRWRSSTSR